MTIKIEWTEDRIMRLHRLYDKAVREKRQIIIFEGHEFVVNYIKYLLEFLDGQFKINYNEKSNVWKS